MRSFLIVLVIVAAGFGWFAGFAVWEWSVKIKCAAGLCMGYGWVMLEIARYLDERPKK